MSVTKKVICDSVGGCNLCKGCKFAVPHLPEESEECPIIKNAEFLAPAENYVFGINNLDPTQVVIREFLFSAASGFDPSGGRMTGLAMSKLANKVGLRNWRSLSNYGALESGSPIWTLYEVLV